MPGTERNEDLQQRSAAPATPDVHGIGHSRYRILPVVISLPYHGDKFGSPSFLAKNNIVNAANERAEFSRRLQAALLKAKHVADSPTQLARDFNARYTGRPITVHAARKWLVGEAIPTQEKLQALAHWLGVSTEWLRFGDDLSPVAKVSDGGPHDEDSHRQLIADLQRLNEHDLIIARNFIRLLVRMNHQ